MTIVKKTELVRSTILAFFLALFTGVTTVHVLWLKTAPSVDFVCPFGGVETLYAFIAGGQFIQRTGITDIVLLSFVVILTFAFSRLFCGWLCGFGGLQEFVGRFGRFLFKRRFNPGKSVDFILKYLKYIVLVVILYMTWRTSEALFIRPYDPVAAWGHIFGGFQELAGDFLVGSILLGLTLVGSLFIDRPFCRYLCPIGAFLGILSLVPIFRIRRDAATCISCNACDRACPVGVKISDKATANPAECIQCGKCVNVCPTGKGTLLARHYGRKTKPVKPLALGLIATVVFAVVIAFGFVMLPQIKVSAQQSGTDETVKSITVDGSTTFEQLLATGMTPEDFKTLTGYVIPNDHSKTVRDFIKGMNLEFSGYKAMLQEWLDSHAKK